MSPPQADDDREAEIDALARREWGRDDPLLEDTFICYMCDRPMPPGATANGLHKECDERHRSDELAVRRGELPSYEVFEQKVQSHLLNMRAREEAQRRHAEDLAAATLDDPFDAGTLAELLAQDDEPPARVEGLIPAEASTLVNAMRKSGKTTLGVNLAHAIITGEDFLGRFPTRRAVGRVAVLNFEVSGRTLAGWARQRGIPDDRLFIVNLRGRPNPFASEQRRRRLADLLYDQCVEVLIVDPFTRAFPGNQNDNSEVAAWLTALDQFARSEAMVEDLVLMAHAGWGGERTRGASALEDWPDSIINLRLDEKEKEHGPRWLSAFGRDIDVDEDELLFQPETKTLTLTGHGSRRQQKDTKRASELVVLVIRVVRRRPGMGVEEILKAVRAEPDAPSFRDREVNAAVRLAIERGRIRAEDRGPGKKKPHYPTDLA